MNYKAVLRIRTRIRIHAFLGLLFPDPDPLVTVMYPDPDPSVIKQKKKIVRKTLISTVLWSIIQKQGSADPDPDPHHQNVMDLQHCYKDTKTTCRHLKKLTCKRTLRQVFIRVYRQETQSCWYFRPSFVSCCPLTFSLVHHTPPSKFSIQYHIQTVCGREGVGMLCPVGDHILQEFNTLYPIWPDS